MVVDTSALVEIYIDGPQAKKVKEAIKPARGHRFMSAASFVEAHIVVRRRFAGAAKSESLFNSLISSYAIVIEPVQEAQARLAVEAYYRFGKAAEPACSTSATVSPTRLRNTGRTRSCSWATTFVRRTSGPQ